MTELLALSRIAGYSDETFRPHEPNGLRSPSPQRLAKGDKQVSADSENVDTSGQAAFWQPDAAVLLVGGGMPGNGLQRSNRLTSRGSETALAGALEPPGTFCCSVCR